MSSKLQHHEGILAPKRNDLILIVPTVLYFKIKKIKTFTLFDRILFSIYGLFMDS